MSKPLARISSIDDWRAAIQKLAKNQAILEERLTAIEEQLRALGKQSGQHSRDFSQKSSF